MEINRELFEEQRRPRFGKGNPERMRLAFWEWMIRGDSRTSTDEGSGLARLGIVSRDGKLKSGHGPYRVRDLFKVPPNREDGPIWNFDRMGATCTELPDGRLVCVGGEHEDYYDPDFCIYNDVVVFGPNDQIEIYGYSKDAFPPTDFHTATLTGNRIIIVGCLGYRETRRSGHTPVYTLDLSGYNISEIKTSGEMPGWIFKHDADFNPEGVITIRGGEFIHEQSGEQRHRRNVEDYALDLHSWVWRRLTNRNWRQFSICQEDKALFVLERHPEPEALLPRSVEHTVVQREESTATRIVVEGVSVSLRVGVSCIEVVVEGELPNDQSMRLAEEVRANAESAINRRCILEEI